MLTTGHVFLWFEHLTRQFLAPLPHRLVADPVHKFHEFKALELRASEDLRPDGVWESLKEERLYGGIAHVNPLLVEHLEPLIEVVVQALRLATLWEIKELRAPGKLLSTHLTLDIA